MGYVAVEFLAWMLVYNTECYLGEEEASKEDNNKSGLRGRKIWQFFGGFIHYVQFLRWIAQEDFYYISR